jgi:hypothetical protein
MSLPAIIITTYTATSSITTLKSAPFSFCFFAQPGANIS